MKKKSVLIVALLMIIALLILVAVYLWNNENGKNVVPTMALIGEENITLKLNENYVEQGAIAEINEEDVSNKIIIEGNVDITKPGEYQVKYIAYNEKNTNSSEIQRTIYVRDEIAPTITLKGKEQVTIYTNQTYKDDGCTAQDNYDGDITNKVSVTGEVDTKKEGEYTITYTVEDSSNNKSEATRKVIVKKKGTTSQKNKSTTNNTTISQENKTTTNNTSTSTAKVNTSKRGLPVLMYHFFYDAKAGEKGPDNNWMEVSAFEEQMKYLSDNNFYFPSWSEVEAYINGTKTLPEKSVVITIDDGDASFIKHAIPIIEKYNVKATSFVVTSWNGDWLPKSYSSSHLNFQSHSHDMHRSGANGKGRFVNLSYAEALEDVTKSKNIIGNSNVFCYPFGHYNDTAKKVLKDAGYKLAFTTKGGRVYPGQDKFSLPRVRMSKGISLSAFKEAVK